MSWIGVGRKHYVNPRSSSHIRANNAGGDAQDALLLSFIGNAIAEGIQRIGVVKAVIPAAVYDGSTFTMASGLVDIFAPAYTLGGGHQSAAALFIQHENVSARNALILELQAGDVVVISDTNTEELTGRTADYIIIGKLFVPPTVKLDIQVFSSSGTWNKPTNAINTYVSLVGAGSGGGSGRRGAAGTIRGGGGGGQGGSYSFKMFPSGALGDTESVTVGAGGIAALGTSTNNTDGNAGSDGGGTTFGSHLTAEGGIGGGGGTNTGGGTGGTGGIGHGDISQAGGNGATGAGASAASDGGSDANALAGAGGGGGGAINASNTGSSASNGGTSAGAGAPFGFTVFSATSGNVGCGPGESGGNGSATIARVQAVLTGGAGAGGGQFSTASGAVNQGFGGNGGNYGGGGAGGAGHLNSTAADTRGGKGGNGLAVVVTEYVQ